MSNAETLKAAKELITDPSHWTQGWFAKTANGGRVDARWPTAECFCMLGAVGRVTNRHYMDLSGHPALEALRRAIPGPDIATFNDDHTHAEVLAAFDRAIELALAEAA